MSMRVATNTVGAVLEQYQRDLGALYPASEVRAIASAVFADALGWNQARVLLDREVALSESELLRVYMPLKRLRTGEPLQYVLGRTLFHGLSLAVGPSVLIPRPETEELVALIAGAGLTPARIVDVGTGSGCIALALKKHFPQAHLTGTDVSADALRMAAANGRANGLEVEWLQQDVLDADRPLPLADLIVSNPPYVPRAEEATLDTHVRAHEPHLALFVDDGDPLLFFRLIGAKALAALGAGGTLWFEGHRDHIARVPDILLQQGFRAAEAITDLSGAPRFVRAVR